MIIVNRLISTEDFLKEKNLKQLVDPRISVIGALLWTAVNHSLKAIIDNLNIEWEKRD